MCPETEEPETDEMDLMQRERQPGDLKTCEVEDVANELCRASGQIPWNAET